MTPHLAEALRSEIRLALEADGKPFDTNVARNVYNLAMAARDMCVAAASSVKEAIDEIKDLNGPMETLDSPGTPETQVQASETFGARLIRELLATLPYLTPKKTDDPMLSCLPKALVHALAEARACGMTDVAEELEIKLFGRVISGVPHDGNDGAVRWRNIDVPLCDACKNDPDQRGGSACYDCREISRAIRVLNDASVTP